MIKYLIYLDLKTYLDLKFSKISKQDLKNVIHAMFCLLVSPTRLAFKQLQLIQDAAARILTEKRKLRILPQCYNPYTCCQLATELISKVLLLIFKSLDCLRPKDISDLLEECKVTRTLRSLGSSELAVPRVRTKTNSHNHYTAHTIQHLSLTICECDIATCTIHNPLQMRGKHYSFHLEGSLNTGPLFHMKIK